MTKLEKNNQSFSRRSVVGNLFFCFLFRKNNYKFLTFIFNRIIVFLFFFIFSCSNPAVKKFFRPISGNAELKRVLHPVHAKDIKIIKKEKSFSIENNDIKIIVEIIKPGELEKIVSEKVENYFYDNSNRVPVMSVYKITAINKAGSRVYLNFDDIQFIADEKEIYKPYTKSEYNSRFRSQSYSAYEYDFLFSKIKKKIAGKNIKKKRKIDKNKKKPNAIENSIIAKRASSEKLCPYKRFSEKWKIYKFVAIYRLLSGDQKKRKLSVAFRYTTKREF